MLTNVTKICILAAFLRQARRIMIKRRNPYPTLNVQWELIPMDFSMDWYQQVEPGQPPVCNGFQRHRNSAPDGTLGTPERIGV